MSFQRPRFVCGSVSHEQNGDIPAATAVEFLHALEEFPTPRSEAKPYFFCERCSGWRKQYLKTNPLSLKDNTTWAKLMACKLRHPR